MSNKKDYPFTIKELVQEVIDHDDVDIEWLLPLPKDTPSETRYVNQAMVHRSILTDAVTAFALRFLVSNMNPRVAEDLYDSLA